MFVLFVSLVGSAAVWADDSNAILKRAVALNVEDDSPSVGGPDSDQAYTGGYRLSFLSLNEELPWWLQLTSIPHPEIVEKNSSIKSISGISISQQVYTPDDIYTARVLSDDRPYAAWIYLGLMSNYQNEDHSYMLELDIGTVGPSAKGEQLQNGIHSILGDRFANGWANQLADEPTLQFFYQQRQKYLGLSSEARGKYLDIIPFYGGAFGNVAINVHVGGYIRYGWGGLPEDFGPTRSSASDGDSFYSLDALTVSRTSFYLFAGGRGTVVGRNIFLDGNTFRSTPHLVTKYPVVFESEFGFASQFYTWNVIWRFVTRSPEFIEKSAFNSFGSVTVMHTY
jgi:hypothetical protein